MFHLTPLPLRTSYILNIVLEALQTFTKFTVTLEDSHYLHFTDKDTETLWLHAIDHFIDGLLLSHSGCLAIEFQPQRQINDYQMLTQHLVVCG